MVGERSRLTRQAVVGQALTLADADGLDAVTIRRLAERLGVTPMALYWHVKSKDELLVAMANQLLTEVTPQRDPGQPWHVQLRATVAALIGAMRAHPCAPALLATAGRIRVDNFTAATETALDVLGQAGFTPHEGFLIASQLLHDVIGLVDRYPRVVEHAAAQDLDPESYFEFGVDLLMAGVEAMAGRRRPTPR